MIQQVRRLFELILFGPDKASLHQRSVGLLSLKRTTTSDCAVSPSILEKPVPFLPDEEKDSNIATSPAPSTGSMGNERLTKSLTWPWRAAIFEPAPSSSWQPSLLQIRPLAGMCALVIAIACIFGSLIILMVSNNKPVTSWRVSPTVHLAIVAAVMNSALAVAHAQAIPVCWWYHATRGASIRALERQWHASNNLMGALLYGKLSIVTLACIATSFVIIDGPLLQRASTVVAATTTSDVTLHLDLSPELPRGFSGNYDSAEYFFTEWGWTTYTNWTQKTQINIRAPQCKGACRATVQGPGIRESNCSSQHWPITGDAVRDFNASWGTWKGYNAERGAITTRNPAFYVNLLRSTEAGVSPDAVREAAVLTTGIVGWTNWTGAYVEKTCYLYSAIVEYDVVIEDNTISLDGESNQGRFVQLANNTTPADVNKIDQIQGTVLDGFAMWLAMFVNANASVALSSDSNKRSTYSADMRTFNDQVVQHWNTSDLHEEDLLFSDPTPGVIFKFNELMFRGGVMSALIPQMLDDPGVVHENYSLDPGVSPQQTVRARETRNQNVYKTDLRWFVGATVVELVTILLVLPMFWGWWTLGRNNFTLSPLTMALAFEAPLLDDVNSGTGARGVVRALGNRGLKFGMVSKLDNAAELAGDRDGQNTPVASGRLGFAETGNVVRPRKGMLFSE